MCDLGRIIPFELLITALRTKCYSVIYFLRRQSRLSWNKVSWLNLALLLKSALRKCGGSCPNQRSTFIPMIKGSDLFKHPGSGRVAPPEVTSSALPWSPPSGNVAEQYVGVLQSLLHQGQWSRHHQRRGLPSGYLSAKNLLVFGKSRGWH